MTAILIIICSLSLIYSLLIIRDFQTPNINILLNALLWTSSKPPIMLKWEVIDV